MKEQKSYIGAKIINAYPMSRLNHLRSKLDGEPLSTEDEPGYEVDYGGYKSWSPKKYSKRLIDQ